MLYPTMSIVMMGVFFAALLAAFDWYIWGMTYAADFRLPRRVRPLGMSASLDRFLSRLNQVNQAVLPQSVLGTPAATNAKTSEHEGHGFKKVA